MKNSQSLGADDGNRTRVFSLGSRVVSVGLSLLGLELGRVLGNTLGQRGELLGGVVLIIVGIAIITQLL